MREFDVAIVGGGLVGCALAYYLAKSGTAVVLIESSDINAGASGQNAGSLHFQIEHRLLDREGRVTKELEDYVALTQIAVGLWQQLERELETDIELVMGGGLMVAENPKELELLERKSDLERKFGLDVELIDGKSLEQHAPYLAKGMAGALLCRQEGHCNPRLVTPAFARRARLHDALIMTRSRVSSMTRATGQWELTIDKRADSRQKEKLRAHNVVNAAGAWAGKVALMANIHLPVFPIPLHMNITERTEPFLHSLIQHVGRRLTMKQVHDGHIIIGGGWAARLQTRDGQWQSEAAPTTRFSSIVGNLRTACDIVPRIAHLNLLRTWTGTAAGTIDLLPIIGEIPQAPGLFVATGGSGFTYGPTYAHFLTELILTGRCDFPIEAYSPNRFGTLNMFMG